MSARLFQFLCIGILFFISCNKNEDLKSDLSSVPVKSIESSPSADTKKTSDHSTHQLEMIYFKGQGRYEAFSIYQKLDDKESALWLISNDVGLIDNIVLGTHFSAQVKFAISRMHEYLLKPHVLKKLVCDEIHLQDRRTMFLTKAIPAGNLILLKDHEFMRPYIDDNIFINDGSDLSGYKVSRVRFQDDELERVFLSSEDENNSDINLKRVMFPSHLDLNALTMDGAIDLSTLNLEQYISLLDSIWDNGTFESCNDQLVSEKPTNVPSDHGQNKVDEVEPTSEKEDTGSAAE